MAKETKKKRIFWGFNPFDYRIGEEIFSRMSEKGWMLESCSQYMAVFKPCEPAKRVFRGAVYDSKDISKRAGEKYVERWEKAGMKYVCDYDRYYWFCTEDGKTMPDEGFASNEEYLIGSAAWRKELYALILSLLAAAFGLIKIYNRAYSSYVTYSEFAKLSLLPVLLPLCLIVYIYGGIWMSRCIKRIRSGRRLKIPGLHAAKLRRILAFLPVSVFFIMLILALILDACSGYAKTVFLLSPVLLVACIFYIVQILKKQGKAAVLGRLIIIAGIIVCIGMYAFGNYRTFSSNMPENGIPAEAVHFEDNKEIKSTSFVHTASPAVKYHYIYKETATDGSSANTEYFSCRNETFADIIYKEVEDALEGEGKDYELERDGNNIIYKEKIYKEAKAEN